MCFVSYLSSEIGKGYKYNNNSVLIKIPEIFFFIFKLPALKLPQGPLQRCSNY